MLSPDDLEKVLRSLALPQTKTMVLQWHEKAAYYEGEDIKNDVMALVSTVREAGMMDEAMGIALRAVDFYCKKFPTAFLDAARFAKGLELPDKAKPLYEKAIAKEIATARETADGHNISICYSDARKYATEGGLQEKIKDIYEDQIEYYCSIKCPCLAVDVATQADFPQKRIEELCMKASEIYEKLNNLPLAAEYALKAKDDNRAKELYGKESQRIEKEGQLEGAADYALKAGQKERADALYDRAMLEYEKSSSFADAQRMAGILNRQDLVEVYEILAKEYPQAG